MDTTFQMLQWASKPGILRRYKDVQKSFISICL